jgi:hypothetical protein
MLLSLIKRSFSIKWAQLDYLSQERLTYFSPILSKLSSISLTDKRCFGSRSSALCTKIKRLGQIRSGSLIRKESPLWHFHSISLLTFGSSPSFFHYSNSAVDSKGWPPDISWQNIAPAAQTSAFWVMKASWGPSSSILPTTSGAEYHVESCRCYGIALPLFLKPCVTRAY